MSLESYDPKLTDSGGTPANHDETWCDIASKLNAPPNAPQLDAGLEHNKIDTVELAYGPRQIDGIVAGWGRPLTDVVTWPKQVLKPLNPTRDVDGNLRIPIDENPQR